VHAALSRPPPPMLQSRLVSRRQVAAQQAIARQLAAAAERGGAGAPASSLPEAHRDMVQRAQFAAIFTADEVADILASEPLEGGGRGSCAPCTSNAHGATCIRRTATQDVLQTWRAPTAAALLSAAHPCPCPPPPLPQVRGRTTS
jgi:hypothetical protein